MKRLTTWLALGGGAGLLIYFLSKDTRAEHPTTTQAKRLAESAQKTFCELYPDSPLCLQDWRDARPVAQLPPGMGYGGGQVLV